MVQSEIQVTVGAGTRLRTATKSISGNTRHEQYHLLGEPDEPTYTMTAGTTSIATAASHILQIMAGTTLHVYVKRIIVTQSVVATTAALTRLGLYRLTTAGTGGVGRTGNSLDTTDGASGATGMTLPTAKGTEGAELWLQTAMLIQTIPTGGPASAPILMELEFEDLRSKAIRIPAGVANGLAIKNIEAVAGASVVVSIEYMELSY